MNELDTSKPIRVQYCIPLWLRNEQIKSACARDIPRLQVHDGPPREEPIAVACYGPSLRDTWEQIHDYKAIITSSGSHKFLTERGIVPTWHVEVDPRPHKIELLGTPNHETIYLPASTCHPEYFDWLEKHGAKIQLWHIFDTQEEGSRILPRGEWQVTGGCNVGLRAMALARMFGYTKQHVFGMDGNVRDDKGDSHAGAHPNAASGLRLSRVTVAGREWMTTGAFYEAATQTFHELDMMKDVDAKFFGDGIVQAMAKEYRRKIMPGPSDIAVNLPILISPEYAELNRRLHKDNLAYGVGGAKHAETVKKMVSKIATQDGSPPSVLDYGCGKGLLAKELPFPIWEYDPAVPGKAETPRAADLVVCTDVLEHIEPDKIQDVLRDLKRCVKQVGYFTIHTGPAQKTLADGRNAHILQKPADWWRFKMNKYFSVISFTVNGPMIYVVVGPKAMKVKRAG